MKFSVLIPTRDRLELLRMAIETVRRQDYDDWEVIVSDNQSPPEVRKYVESLEDPRIRWFGTSQVLPVTDNWNRALDRSTGDYVVMLGDDDGLLPGYFRALAEVIDRFDEPDAIYSDALQFAYPNVLPTHPAPFVQLAYSELFQGRTRPFVSPSSDRMAAVKRTMGIRLAFSYNMQHFVLSRKLVARLSTFGPLFQSPYPDYFASNLVLLEAAELVLIPQPMVMIGISPKSFGFYYVNDRAQEGTDALGSFDRAFVPEAMRSAVLPGNPLLTGWFLAMAWLEQRVGVKHGLKVDTGRYRYLQVAWAVQRRGLRAIRSYTPFLRVGELAHFTARLCVANLVSDSRRAEWRRRESPWPPYHPELLAVAARTILDLFETTQPLALDWGEAPTS